jgi:GDP/UDP-N,N'-diacetylbacillosamine 2-epimerase (hydrolysing)
MVAAALIARIPIAHIQGGELTEGAFDDAIRHSITKMSHLHFVANDVYRNRVIQLGEHPDSVFTVGGLRLDTMSRIKLLKREDLEAALDFKFGDRNLLVTFHLVTLENNTSSTQIHELLAALEMLHGTHLIFTMPNADTDSRNLFDIIHSYCSLHPNAKLFTTLGRLLYLSCMNQVDGVIGNSSSGLTEAPSFNIGTVNIGDRQKGRLSASSVIDAESNAESINAALHRLFSEDFDNSLDSTVNPYGTPGASDLIVYSLENILKTNSLKKRFCDL